MSKKEFLKFREKDLNGNWIIKPRFEVKEEKWAKVEKALAAVGITFRSPDR